jgi:hypothetical protein
MLGGYIRNLLNEIQHRERQNSDASDAAAQVVRT